MTEGSKAREFEFEEPIEFQEWYNVGADVRINIRRQFYKATTEIDRLQSELTRVNNLLSLKAELLRECEETLQSISHLKEGFEEDNYKAIEWADQLLQKLREGKEMTNPESKPLQLWIKSNGNFLPNNRNYICLDDEQARDYQEKLDGEFGPPKGSVRFIEKSAYDKAVGALKKYGQHTKECICHKGHAAYENACDCGFDEALKELGEL